MSEILNISNLTVAFENGEEPLTAVRGVSLAIKKGETLALVGESGCGKTVLCKSMMKMLCSRGEIKSGSIILGERNIENSHEKDMVRIRGKEIAMIFQDPMVSLDPGQKVGEQIAEAIRTHEKCSRSEAKKGAIRLMDLVKIPEAERRYNMKPYQFSGGMRQRIAIAVALAASPELVLADEPTTALDEETRREILELIIDIQREKQMAVLFITHDLSLVPQVASRVAIMKDGVIVEEGPVEHVFLSPVHDYTKKLLGYFDYTRDRGHNHREKKEEDVIAIGKGVCKSYGEISVLEDFDIEIHKGEIVGLVGKSGCGKSTFARCLMGIEKPDKGSIEIKEGIRKHLVFQDSQSAFNDRMSVGEIIWEPEKIRTRKKPDMRRIAEVMKNCELDEKLVERKPYELSGGQRQRVAIARALITEPDFLILDEPLTGLDVSAQAQIVHLLKKLSEEKNIAMLFIAHDLPMVNHISSRVIKM